MKTVDIVNLIEKNPITRLSQTYNNKLLCKIKSGFTEEQQQLFVASFYCYLNYNQTTDFVIDLDNIWEWLGFSQKVIAKRTLEKHFTINTHYKILLYRSVEQEQMHGGHNKETILLTIQTFKLFCIKSATKKASEIHEYFVKLEQILQDTLHEETTELRLQLEQQQEETKKKEEELKKQQEELKKKQDEIKKLQETKGKLPMIYIYNTDIKQKNAPLKIGMSNSINERTKPFKQTHPNGKIVFRHEITGDNMNLQTFEKFIHSKFKDFRVQGEIFQLDTEEATMSLMTDVMLYELYENTNQADRQQKMRQIYEYVRSVIHKIPKQTNEIACQTEEADLEPITTESQSEDPKIAMVKKFIQEHCIVRNDVQVCARKISGLFRVLNKNKKREVSDALNNYLQTHFKYGKIYFQDKNQLIYGYSGITIIEPEYKKALVACDEETFVFEQCIFTPEGTLSYNELFEDYIHWRTTLEKPITGDEDKSLRKYLSGLPYLMCASVNVSGTGACYGYYGISNKKHIRIQRKNISTAKTVEKRDMNGKVLCVYESVAKAADSERFCTAKISRAIRDRRIFENDTGEKYYYALKGTEHAASAL